VPSESIKVALGTVISLMPNGTGGCSTSSGVSDIQDLVTITCRYRVSSTLARLVLPRYSFQTLTTASQYHVVTSVLDHLCLVTQT
jgi:hypothetical protein